MIILKHVEHRIKDVAQLEGLLKHLDETTSKVEGITLQDIFFPKGKEEFILILECKTEDSYLEWRELCPPPLGAKDCYEVFLTRNEHFSTQRLKRSRSIQSNDFGWYLKTFDALFGFIYIHYVNMVQKPDALRENRWDFFADQYHYITPGTYNLMAGYAVETLMKCCLDNSGWKGQYMTHDLPSLAKKLSRKWKISIPSTLLKDLEEFQEYIEWKGKYPFPKNVTANTNPNIGMGYPYFQKTRETWSFFYNELRKNDPVLAGFNLTLYKNDSRGVFDESMEMFDIVAQIAKEKLTACGKYVLSMP